MAAINMSSIMGKVAAYGRSVEGKLRMKQCIEGYVSSGVDKTAAGSKVVTVQDMKRLARNMIEILQDVAIHCEPPLPESVMTHFRLLSAKDPEVLPDGSYVVFIDFGGDLHRDSLEDGDEYYEGKYGGFTGEGIDNIVALFNNGAHAKDYTYGWWNGHSATGDSVMRSGVGGDFAWVKSKKDREALHFIQRAIQNFNDSYGAEYDVTAEASPRYSE